MISKDIGHSAR